MKTNLYFVRLHYQISRGKFKREPGLKLGPPDQPGALPFSYPVISRGRFEGELVIEPG